MLDLAKNISALKEKKLLNEVIILNNKSSESYTVVEEFINNDATTPFRYFIAEENLGVARGRNLAAQKATSPVLVFIDDDALFEKQDTISQLYSFFSDEKSDNVGILAFKIFYLSTMNFQPNAFPHKRFKQRKDLHDFNTYFFSGCAHAIRKKVFDKAGYYPENFFYGMEEYDLSYRTIKAGFRIVYDDRIIVLHKESPSGRLTNKDKLRSLWVNKSKVAWKYLPKKYFYSTAILWSLQYLRKTNWNISGWIKGWKEILKISKKEKRDPLNIQALNYLKEVEARLTY